MARLLKGVVVEVARLLEGVVWRWLGCYVEGGRGGG